MTTYHLTVSLPDEFDSLQHLKTLVDTEGQKLKQLLFEKVFTQVSQKHKTTRAQLPCPHCQKKKHQKPRDEKKTLQ